MKMTKQDKARLAEEYAKVWTRRDGSVDEKMVEHCVKSTSGMAWFGDKLLTFDKPHIQTHFWMGEHTYDYDEVCQAAQAAGESYEYFIEENVDDCRAQWTLDAIERGSQEPYLTSAYYGKNGNPLAHVTWRNHWEPEPDGRKMTDEEIAKLKQLCEEEVEKFRKRLNTYLKRYGLSKVHCSVYWADR